MKRTKPSKPRPGAGGKRVSAVKRARGARASVEKRPKRTLGAPKSVDEYIGRVAEPARSALCEIRGAIRSVVPREATEVISYGIPAFRHNGVLAWFGAFSDHCSLFPTAAVIEVFKGELRGFSTSKGTVHFPTGKPVPTELIKKIMKERIAQIESKKRH